MLEVQTKTLKSENKSIQSGILPRRFIKNYVKKRHISKYK